MSAASPKNDVRLIEAGFPCHQVGAERGGSVTLEQHRLHTVFTFGGRAVP